MKLITRDTDYAVKALIFIARRKKGLTSASELVAALNVPRSFLRKILQLLNKKRILNSYRGKGGGFALALAPKKIFLLDVMRTFQGPLKINECMFKSAPCPDKSACRLRKKINNIQGHIIAELKEITLASLLKKGAKK